MKVFIANFGQQNYLWPACLERSTVATINNVQVQPFWEARDRKGYVAYALANMKTARGETPTPSVASRWYGLTDEVANTNGDIWIHREKTELWWTTTRPDTVQIELKPSRNNERDGPEIYELHKPCDPWTDRTRKDGRLSWNGLHPKAKDFLFTEGTLQQLQPDNAAYALALIAGVDLSAWHDRPEWKRKVERSSSKASAGRSLDPIERAAWIMARTALNTVAQSNGQQTLRTMKNKDCDMSEDELRAYVATLIRDQDELCAITGLRLQFEGDHDDLEQVCSLDRIDSDGHYVRGNLQVVCRFVNRWKSDAPDGQFRRLMALVRSSAFVSPLSSGDAATENETPA